MVSSPNFNLNQMPIFLAVHAMQPQHMLKYRKIASA